MQTATERTHGPIVMQAEHGEFFVYAPPRNMCRQG